MVACAVGAREAASYHAHRGHMLPGVLAVYVVHIMQFLSFVVFSRVLLRSHAPSVSLALAGRIEIRNSGETRLFTTLGPISQHLFNHLSGCCSNRSHIQQPNGKCVPVHFVCCAVVMSCALVVFIAPSLAR